MHPIHNFIATLVTLLLFAIGETRGGQVEKLLIYNNGSLPANIWVNGAYQGYVKSGEARHTLKEGFYTNDSGFQEDGSLVEKWAYAGWDSSSDPITVTVRQFGLKDKLFEASIQVSGDEENKGYIWCGESDPGQEPYETVWELAPPIINDHAPYTKKVTGTGKAKTRRNQDDLGFLDYFWRFNEQNERRLYIFNKDGTCSGWELYIPPGEEDFMDWTPTPRNYSQGYYGKWTLSKDNSISTSDMGGSSFLYHDGVLYWRCPNCPDGVPGSRVPASETAALKDLY
jgi:hypothetical protein